MIQLNMTRNILLDANEVDSTSHSRSQKSARKGRKSEVERSWRASRGLKRQM